MEIFIGDFTPQHCPEINLAHTGSIDNGFIVLCQKIELQGLFTSYFYFFIFIPLPEVNVPFTLTEMAPFLNCLLNIQCAENSA